MCQGNRKAYKSLDISVSMMRYVKLDYCNKVDHKNAR